MTDQSLGPVRERLAALGLVGLAEAGAVDEERRAVRRIEELGYGSIWCGKHWGKEAFATSRCC